MDLNEIRQRPAAPETVRREVRRYLHQHWRAFSLQGLLMALTGVAALVAPLLATRATSIFLGWLILSLAAAAAIACFRMRDAAGFWSNLTLTVLLALLALVILADAFAGAVTLTTVLAVYFLLTGLAILSLARAFRASTGRFWLLAAAGALNVALAFFLVIGLPGTAAWAVGIFLGLSLVMSGLSLLAAALDARTGPKAGR
ncbi:HdeD family acid-resistance protein [Aureimonas pseudogalii]|uniref:Uncharacterized membrane protein HdeD (DUF308 family) n=1 Tax=Aureimonas pseudogalii TaxID=1744844 RepID=A0A7W6EAI8_9HYPH|nr:DUF308 domain-containing protein [Aureimonas pseudogalii]MBB3997716.1 uncharacterized membrane protein HdeD (DUF308 family) [Aureimonas pseudogalii]